MKSASVSLTILSVVLMVSTFALAADQSKVDKERQEIRNRTKEILAQLYKAQPSAKAAVSKAAGYAVFSNFGMKIFVLGSGTGKGIARDGKTKKETFMKMVELQTGLGFGVKKFSLVWVFEKPDALATFVNSGWELGTQASAAAKAGERAPPSRAPYPCHPAFGSINSPRPVWRWSSRRRGRSTTRTTT